MTEIYCMTQKHKYWNETICLAEKSPWKAGPYLALKMKNMTLIHGKGCLLLA